MKIRVQEADFDAAAEAAALRAGRFDLGALVSFTGLVRADNHQGPAEDYTLELEHYPGMTERVIEDMAGEASRRFDLQDVTIIHRVGALPAGAQIVLVLTAARHRRGAFEGAEFLMDYLKTQAPFWKKVRDSEGGRWIDARASDDRSLERWGVASDNAPVDGPASDHEHL